MSTAAEQFNAICKANLDTARQFAAMSLDSAENMLKAWPEFYQDSAQKAWDLVRGYMENVTKAQSDFPRFIQEQAVSANRNFIESMQALASTQRTWDLVRGYMENVTKAQSDFPRFIQEQAVSVNTNFIESMQALASAAGAAKPTTEHAEHKPRKVA